MLDVHHIKTLLAEIMPYPAPDLLLYQSIDSTHDFLKTRDIDALCIAETQTAGRGRLGRQWHSPFGENIYCSWRMPWQKSIHESGCLSLLVGVSVLKMLTHLGVGVPIKLKWPNDLMFLHQKLGGILIELIHDEAIIISLGLNINSDPQNSTSINRPWCSLYSITQKKWDRNVLMAHFIHQLNQDLSVFIQEGFESFKNIWKDHDYLYQKSVILSRGSKIISGKALGIDAEGQLEVIEDDGTIHHFSSGEVTLSL